MRTLAITAVVASLIAGAPVMAETQGAPGSSSGSEQSQEQENVTIRSIQVVDVEDLQPEVRSKVDALMANSKQEDLQSLRASIDSIPQAVSALKAKGRVTAQVVAINIDQNGTLTMFTKKSA